MQTYLNLKISIPIIDLSGIVGQGTVSSVVLVCFTMLGSPKIIKIVIGPLEVAEVVLIFLGTPPPKNNLYLRIGR